VPFRNMQKLFLSLIGRQIILNREYFKSQFYASRGNIFQL
jgi:hypothetical protein